MGLCFRVGMTIRVVLASPAQTEHAAAAQGTVVMVRHPSMEYS
jgi:hypothetical protein